MVTKLNQPTCSISNSSFIVIETRSNYKQEYLQFTQLDFLSFKVNTGITSLATKHGKAGRG